MVQNNPKEAQQSIMADLFEACFIEMVQGLAEKNNLKKGDFAEQVWPESSTHVARNRWIRMRTTDSRTGKPVSCSLADAYRMAMALGLQMAYVTLQAENLAEQRFKQMDQSGELEHEVKAPRRKRQAAAG
ncbi:hypothetical protein LJB99_05765 [Deltaproteobacteria bacterium OttesenSCG-928-K17]|nr:hypothetical protein [Deltaproteobacteria bacterium OttesenSCG-928-K17]